MKQTIAKEQRTEAILFTLKKLGYASRTQLQRIHRLGGDRNANRVLTEMREYLCSVRLEENVYYLNAEGRERVGCQRVLKKTGQVTHYLMRNALFIAFGCPASWRSEVKLEVSGEAKVIADALFSRENRYYICEIDNTQKMAANRDKIARYRRMVELGVFKQAPAFVWLTTTEYRRQELAKLCEGLCVKIYTASELR
ncbi:replication-relaxation family protein [Bacillus sp. JJ722]|uniref:replication-relaxation family protein n=1 Tax=Bacillus sp. JJ722 TaxID=3122973 RepID=UPI002FFF8A9B